MRKNILLIRSSALLFEKALKDLSPNVRITALVDARANTAAIKASGADEVICVGTKGGFRFRDCFRFLKQIKGRSFDEVIVLYNNKQGNGYANVDFFALLSPAKKRFAQNYDRQILAISFLGFFSKIFIEVAGYFWFLINVCVTLMSLLLIAMGMIFVEILVMVKRSQQAHLPEKTTHLK